MQTIPDVDERHKRLVELNVQESCINLFANPIVQKKQATSSQPHIHGWVYDVATGLLKKLDIDFKVLRASIDSSFAVCCFMLLCIWPSLPHSDLPYTIILFVRFRCRPIRTPTFVFFFVSLVSWPSTAYRSTRTNNHS